MPGRCARRGAIKCKYACGNAVHRRLPSLGVPAHVARLLVERGQSPAAIAAMLKVDELEAQLENERTSAGLD